MYTDIQNQVNDIKESLLTELRQTKAIDANGKVVNAKAFETCVKSKIEELNKMESLVVDANGVSKNRYGTGIWFDAISDFNDMLKHQSLNPRMDKVAQMHDTIDTKIRRPSAFRRAIGKMFKKKTSQYQKTEKLR
jgi:hypothetical protein